MKKFISLAFVYMAYLGVCSQNYIDTVFTIDSELDLIYGNAIDFAGNERELLLDVSYPNNDTIPSCGRPLLVVIHGGAFISGSKNEGYIPTIREHFAKRGYTTAAINYRLGQFQPSSEINCNTSAFGLEWNCLNMADTLEWYRAYHRGIQDANGAIRYLINNAEEFDINPDNVFVVGESAGGFIAMGTAFIDQESEVNQEAIADLGTIAAPNMIYESSCIQGYGLDTSIASMNLERPNLGSYLGTLNFPIESQYKIKGVGNFYGAVFDNIFYTEDNDPPALYMFHQPNDLIVPFNHNKVLAGFSLCASGFPFNCQAIVNRPFIYGSNAIDGLLEDMLLEGVAVPEYLFEPSSNTADCALQVLDPSLTGHAFDNFWLRTGHMASFFSNKIAPCISIDVEESLVYDPTFTVYPNPNSDGSTIHIKGNISANDELRILDISGRCIYEETIKKQSKYHSIQLNNKYLNKGLYIVEISNERMKKSGRLIIQ